MHVQSQWIPEQCIIAPNSTPERHHRYAVLSALLTLNNFDN